MGSDKGTSTTVQNTTTERELTPEERQLLQLQVQQQQTLVGPQTELQLSSIDTANRLIKGEVPNGFYGNLYAGIDQGVTDTIVNQSLKDLQPRFQQSGLVDSGVAAAISARTAADIRTQAEQYNINNRFNLLNLALGGQAQVQQPILGQSANLNNQIINSSAVKQNGVATNTTKSMNPFLSSFETSLGKSLGSGTYGGKSYFGTCWVASEIFGGWSMTKTMYCRFYMIFHAPKWFRSVYSKFGEKFALFIKNKPIIKIMLRPLFEYLAYLGKVKGS